MARNNTPICTFLHIDAERFGRFQVVTRSNMDGIRFFGLRCRIQMTANTAISPTTRLSEPTPTSICLVLDPQMLAATGLRDRPSAPAFGGHVCFWGVHSTGQC